MRYPVWRDPDYVSLVKSLGRICWVPAGFLFFIQGEPPPFLYLILQGLGRLAALHEDGSERLIRFTHAYDVLGLPSALVGEKPKYTAEAVTRCQVVALPREETLKAIHTDPVFNEGILSTLVSTIAQMCDHEAIPPNAASEWRVAAGLLHLVKRTALGTPTTPLALHLTHQQLAECFNLHRVTVSQCLKRLEVLGFVETGHRAVTISDLNALEGYVSDGAEGVRQNA